MIVEFGSVAEADFEALVELRLQAMRPSLEKIGRFDPVRSRARFRDSFSPEHTRTIFLDGAQVGFYTVIPTSEALKLEHLYISPSAQGQGVGGFVLSHIFTIADEKSLPVRVGALKGSDSNHFYLRHGFIKVDEAEWDIYYERLPNPQA